MRRLWVVVLALLPVAAWAQPPIWWNGGGGGSGTVAPSSFSSPTGTLTVGGTTDAVTLDADTTIVPLYSTGTSDPATCTAGGMFHLRTDSTLLKICAATDTWLTLYTITDDSVLVGTGTTTASKAIPDCDDTGGQHLNYDTATNAFSCGTSSGSSSFDPTAVSLFEDFLSGTATNGQIGVTGYAGTAVATGTFSLQTGTTTNPGIMRLNSHATNDNSGVVGNWAQATGGFVTA